VKVVFNCIILLFIAHVPCVGQPDEQSSSLILKLEKKLNTINDPKQKLILLDKLFSEYEFRDSVKARKYNDQAFLLARETKNTRALAQCFNHLGFLYEDRGDIENAKIAYEKSLHVAELANDKLAMSKAHNNLGIIYKVQGNYPEAIRYYHLCLEFDLQRNDSVSIGGTYVNIGEVYRVDQNYKMAIENYKKAEQMFMNSDADYEKAVLYNDMAITVEKLEDIEGTRKYLHRGIYYYEKAGMASGISTSTGNLALSFSSTNEHDSAYYYARLSQEYGNRSGDSLAIIHSYKVLGMIYKNSGRADEAIVFLKKCLPHYSQYHLLEDLENTHYIISDAYRKTGEHKLALEHLHESLLLKAEISGKEKSKQIAEMESKFKSAQKDKEILMKNAEIEKSNAKVQQQELENESNRYKIYGLGGGFILLIVFLGFIIKSSQARKKANRLLRLQRDHIAEQNKEIKSSISYAKRIQEAILPPVSQISEAFPDSFVIYMPKDIVAGDFYFFEKTKEHVFIAAADCTGHGVPGALVSVVCSNALSRCVKEFGLTEPGKILDKTRELILETFQKSTQNVSDGMDISLCSFKFGVLGSTFENQQPETNNIKHRTISWSGANNPLLFSQNGELKELSPDKQPVGKTDKAVPFTTKEIILNKGDSLFLFTDGYADQFGGPKGKKLKYSSMKKTINDCRNQAASSIQQSLSASFSEWKGNLEQVDDVCIIGIKI